MQQGNDNLNSSEEERLFSDDAAEINENKKLPYRNDPQDESGDAIWIKKRYDVSGGCSNISFEIEKKLAADGYKIIAGIDEAGRGALAGPLVVGLVIYSIPLFFKPAEDLLSQIRDSKVLSPKKRNSSMELIDRRAVFYCTSIVPHQIIDKLNINGATEYAVKELVKKSNPRPDAVIMDGNFKFKVGLPFFSIVDGDAKSISIASGSIVAKVTRDRIMEKYEFKYPGYSLFKNKGYGTLEHQEAISRLGPCEIHRRTYEPVKSYTNKSSI